MPTSLDSIFFAGPYLLCYCLRSRPHLSVVPRQLSLLSRRQLPASSFFQPTLFRVPLPLPNTARFQVQKSFVWFRAKTDKGVVCLAATHIVLHSYEVYILISLFAFFYFHPVVRQDGKAQYSTGSPFFSFFFFLLFYCPLFRSIGWDSVIYLYLVLVCLVLQDEFWVVHMSLVRIVKFRFFAQLPIDYLPHPVVSNLLLFWG